jgi:hypothetical protein
VVRVTNLTPGSDNRSDTRSDTLSDNRSDNRSDTRSDTRECRPSPEVDAWTRGKGGGGGGTGGIAQATGSEVGLYKPNPVRPIARKHLVVFVKH